MCSLIHQRSGIQVIILCNNLNFKANKCSELPPQLTFVYKVENFENFRELRDKTSLAATSGKSVEVAASGGFQNHRLNLLMLASVQG